MRRLIGWTVLILGVAGLGIWASMGAAVRMQDNIADGARAIAQTAPLGVKVDVSGRDITATGQITDAAARDALAAQFQSINGVRVVDVSGLATLPLADPYEVRFIRTTDRTARLVGVVPSRTARDQITTALSTGTAIDLTLAAGVPDDAWVGVAQSIITAGQVLQWGDVAVSGRAISVRGQIAVPAAQAGIDAALADLPDGYTARVDLTYEDDGAPLSLRLSRDETVAATGKLPADLPLTDLSDVFSGADLSDITTALIPAENPDWPQAARAGITALAALTTGDLALTADSLTLTGAGSPDGLEQARAALGTVPDTLQTTSDLTLWDDGAPFVFTLDWVGDTGEVTGKLPVDFTPSGPIGVTITDTAARSFLADTDGRFTQNTFHGVAALGLLQAGSVTASADAITITGTATSPQVAVAMGLVLDNVADETDTTLDLTYLDDGSPAAWTVRYTAHDGATVEGRLPTTLTLSDLSTALGVAQIAGDPVTAAEDDDAGSSLATLTTAARYLPEVEALTYARDGQGSALDLILSPGVDIDLVATDLAETLPGDVAFSLGPLDAMPATGTLRTNAATGLTEVFSGGFWLPDLNFSTDVAGCAAASDQVLTAGRLNFLSGSARLDATSIRAINTLAAIVRPCLEAGLLLEIGGHTDTTGSAFDNDELSFDRAAAVRAALVTRGALARKITVEGYGQTQPIADNDTPEGRAANRRTTLIWTDP